MKKESLAFFLNIHFLRIDTNLIKGYGKFVKINTFSTEPSNLCEIVDNIDNDIINVYIYNYSYIRCT